MENEIGRILGGKRFSFNEEQELEAELESLTGEKIEVKSLLDFPSGPSTSILIFPNAPTSEPIYSSDRVVQNIKN